ncbi:LytTR family DNA-binding domain-containing protein [Shewanella holmiensis]|uniref:LytTR family transcriptional regulator n=1 Tax=Shewanella holmiensis TaxID=2952222 RepID=A0A9X3ANS1_9GAMM|nr:LytTR family DNA-binding domain-containing protein [Shewanella holmiensis]MCT7942122.1 LytTR family transcriptional regulator [Shewanella holmiensis]
MTNREIPSNNQQLKSEPTKNKLLQQLLIVVSIGLFIGFMRPFGMDQFTLLLSMSYWVFTCVCGYLIYMPLINLGHKYLAKSVTTLWQRVAISSLLASLIMSLIVPFIGWLFFEQTLHLADNFLLALPNTLVIGSIITFISMLQNHVDHQKQQLEQSQHVIEQSKKVIERHQQNNDINALQIEQFMALLPLEKRGKLLCLEMDDHYLKVHTDKGQHMLLMRLKDALMQLEGFPGLQTHRSWWVANHAVVSVNKENRKMSLLLTNHLEVPVSRTFVEAVKANLAL